MFELLGVTPQALFGQFLNGLINGSFYALLSLGGDLRASQHHQLRSRANAPTERDARAQVATIRKNRPCQQV